MIKVLVIISVIIAWIICAIVTYGIIEFLDYIDEIGDEALFMFGCIICWPLLIVITIGYFLLKKLSNLGEFVGGFLHGVFGKKGYW